MIAGSLIGFLVWVFLVVVMYCYYSVTHKGFHWEFKPNYGGMLVLMLLGASIGYFF